MAKVGIKCLTYAKVTGGGDGSAMVEIGTTSGDVAVNAADPE